MNVHNCILGTTNGNALRWGIGCEGPYYVVAPDGYKTSCSTLENAAAFIVAMGWQHEQPVDVRDRLTDYELHMLELCKSDYHRQCIAEMNCH